MISGLASPLTAYRSQIVKSLRIAYAICAFAGSLVIHQCGESHFAYAQERTQDLQSQILRNSDQVIHVSEKLKEIDEHIAATDVRTNVLHEEQSKRINEQSDRISIMQGVGVGISATLGALQLLTLLAGKKQ